MLIYNHKNLSFVGILSILDFLFPLLLHLNIHVDSECPQNWSPYSNGLQRLQNMYVLHTFLKVQKFVRHVWHLQFGGCCRYWNPLATHTLHSHPLWWPVRLYLGPPSCLMNLSCSKHLVQLHPCSYWEQPEGVMERKSIWRETIIPIARIMRDITWRSLSRSVPRRPACWKFRHWFCWALLLAHSSSTILCSIHILAILLLSISSIHRGSWLL